MGKEELEKLIESAKFCINDYCKCEECIFYDSLCESNGIFEKVLPYLEKLLEIWNLSLNEQINSNS